MSDVDSIRDDMDRASFMADAPYRVKAIDEDAGGGGNGAFHQQLEQEEEELDSEDGREDGHDSPLEADSTGRSYEASIPEDHVILSDAVKGTVDEVADSESSGNGEKTDENEHLNIVA